ncbi:MarR family transcriptional regulator [Rhizobium sp. KVB221]|uniref:MarR family transcriptional regulator n=1 Tax=Rhizobium setariae TaxID=2801340 RepID=A0A936YSZ6_9HYPH|nr:MarR family transcriptional regulator [Rhizobium setariae]MBL0374261.1 MarR family transcriptional regulator [Rhizobium setariae]
MTDQEKPSILPMSRSFGNSLRHVNRLIQRDLGVRTAPLGLALGQWYALRTLWNEDGLTQIELAQKSGIAGPAMVLAVRSLLATGLVSRRRPPNDKRKYVISLTEKGRQLEEAALRAAMAANDVALEGIPKADIDICMRVLEAARQNLLKTGMNLENQGEIDALIE